MHVIKYKANKGIVVVQVVVVVVDPSVFLSYCFRVSTNFHFASSWKISTRKLSS